MSAPRKAPSQTLSSIYQDGTGRWHGKVTMGRLPGGKVDRKHVSGKTKAAVTQSVRDLERRRDDGTYVWTADNPRLGGWLNHWLDNITSLSVKQKTLLTYRSMLRKHVIPVLGQERLDALTPEMFEALYTDLARSGLSTYTVHAVHRITRSALSEAVRRQKVAKNPLVIARPPRIVESEIEPLSREDIAAVLRAARESRNGARWSVALALGLRQGEALGLTWSDIDLDRCTLRVSRGLERAAWNHGCRHSGGKPQCGESRPSKCPQRKDGGLVLKDTKTRAGRRTWALPEGLAAEIRSHRAAQAQERLQAGDHWHDGDFVFATPLGQPIDPRNDGRAWKALLKAAGVREVRLHDARHSAATMLLLQGVSPRVVMTLMGWTDHRVMERYVHVVDEMRLDAARRVNEAWWPGAEGT